MRDNQEKSIPHGKLEQDTKVEFRGNGNRSIEPTKFAEREDGGLEKSQGNVFTHRDALIVRIRVFTGLPGERRLSRYSSFLPDEEGFAGKKSLGLKQAEELADFLVHNPEKDKENEELTEENIAEYIERIVNGAADNSATLIQRCLTWLNNDEKEIGSRLEFVGQRLAQAIASRQKLEFAALAFLGELEQQERPSISHLPVLTKAVERAEMIESDALDKMAALNRLNDAAGNLLLHKIIDFFETHLETLQNEDTPEKFRHKEFAGYDFDSNDVYNEFAGFAKSESKLSGNYLIKKHLQNYYQELFGETEETKPGTLYGVAGGARDETIYTFQNIAEGYKNRLALGSKDGWPARNPVLKIAPGYYGYYQDGNLKYVYREDQLDPQKAKQMEQKLITENNQEDEWIYKELAEPLSNTQYRKGNNSYKLDALKAIWKHRDSLRASGREFFFDLSKINAAELHPFVFGDILTHNQGVISKHPELIDGKEPESISLDEFMKSAFPAGTERTEQKYNYQYFTRLGMRKVIKDEFGIDIGEMPLPAQSQFLHVLAGKDAAEFDKLKEQLDGCGSDKPEVIESFVAVAEDDKYSDIILELAEQLKEIPAERHKLFVGYNELTRKLDTLVSQLSVAHKTIFTDVDFDRTQAFKAILAKTNEILAQAQDRLQVEKEETAPVDIIDELVERFKNEEEALERIFIEFEASAQAVQNKLKDISRMFEEQPDPAIDTTYFYREFFDPRAWEEEKRGGIEEWREELPMSGIPEHMQGKILEAAEKEIRERPRRATSQRIRLADKHLEDMIREFEEMDGKIDEQGEKFVRDEYKTLFLGTIKPIYEKMRRELAELLKFQKALEAKFQHLATGEKEASLPRGFLSDLEKETASLAPERLPQEEPLYFPVGISVDLPEWRKVLAGEKQAGKPIDIYSYLFWLNNQGKQAKLVVADEIQATNYQSKYGVSQEEAIDVSRAIGERERETYQKIIDVFGLNNITVQDYQSFRQERSESIVAYEALCRTLLAEPVFEKAFLRLVPESVAGGSEQEKKQHLAYALEEVSWILATGGTKVGHRNEAGYDALAAFIAGAEIFAKQSDKSLARLAESEKEREFFIAVLNGSLLKLTNEFDRRRPARAGRAQDSESAVYLDNVYENLRAIKQDLKKISGRPEIMPANMKKTAVPFNFVSPSVGSQSFGWRGRGGKGEEPALKFREPYSTYFYQNGGEVFLNSEQVVAVPDGLIGGKVLALDAPVQQKYSEQVLKPLLLQYFKSLEVAPRAYFDKVGKDRRELLRECRRCASVLDVIKFIQKYVAAPAAPEPSKPAAEN